MSGGANLMTGTCSRCGNAHTSIACHPVDWKSLIPVGGGGTAFVPPSCSSCAKLRADNERLRKHLKNVCMIAERLGPRVSLVHQEEALALLDGTISEAREALGKERP